MDPIFLSRQAHYIFTQKDVSIMLTTHFGHFHQKFWHPEAHFWCNCCVKITKTIKEDYQLKNKNKKINKQYWWAKHSATTRALSWWILLLSLSFPTITLTFASSTNTSVPNLIPLFTIHGSSHQAIPLILWLCMWSWGKNNNKQMEIYLHVMPWKYVNLRLSVRWCVFKSVYAGVFKFFCVAFLVDVSFFYIPEYRQFCHRILFSSWQFPYSAIKDRVSKQSANSVSKNYRNEA